jgi:RES domain-containing protein
MVHRRLFRIVHRDRKADPVPSVSRMGRFHGKPREVSYLAETPMTAWKEVRAHWPADPSTHLVVDIDVDLDSVLDLTDETMQRECGITPAELVQAGPAYEPCQRLAQRLQARGVSAIWTYSAADQPDGRVLVVFLDNLGPSSALRVLDARPVDFVEPE